MIVSFVQLKEDKILISSNKMWLKQKYNHHMKNSFPKVLRSNVSDVFIWAYISAYLNDSKYKVTMTDEVKTFWETRPEDWDKNHEK